MYRQISFKNDLQGSLLLQKLKTKEINSENSVYEESHSLREKCPNTDFFWFVFFCIRT